VGPNGTNGDSVQQTRTPRRTMADITQLFMTGAKTPSTPPPQRMTPPPAPQPIRTRADLERELLGLPAEIPTQRMESPRTSIPASSNASYMIPSRPTPELIASLRRWAKARGACFGVISLDAHALRVLQIDGRDKPAIAPAATINPQGVLDLQLGRVLYDLRQTVSQWIIATPEEQGLARHLLTLANEHVLVCGIQDDGLIDAYRALKSFNSDSEELAGVRLLLEAPTLALAQRWHQRLNGVAKEFLHQELALEQFTAGPAAEIGCIAMVPIVDLPADDKAALGQAIEDFFRDIAEEVDDPAEADELSPETVKRLDTPVEEEAIHTIVAPEERAALEDNWPGTEPAPVVAPPVPQVVMAPRVETPIAPSCDVLNVRDMPAQAGPAEQWRIIEQGIPTLLTNAAILDARPPWDHAALAVDTQKQLHLWVLANAADPFEWPAIQAWANAHRDLIALTCRDVKLNTSKPVQVHVVLPLDAASASMQRAWPTEIKWYRLQKMQWQDRTGVAVIGL
jgi:hypothetical protein